MASSFARNVLGVASRASMRSSSASAMRSVSRSVMRRGMSSTSHGHGHSAPSSDKAWIIASALVFGPATLYILSPSGKTHNTGHHGHEDNHASSHSTTKGEEVKHEPPAAAAEAVKEESDAAPVLVKDDEGKVEDVKESLKAAETDDVPKADPSANEQHVAETGKPLFNTDSETATLVAEAEKLLDAPKAEEKVEEKKEASPSELAAAPAQQKESS